MQTINDVYINDNLIVHGQITALTMYHPGIPPVGMIISLDPDAPAPDSSFWTLLDGTAWPMGSFITGTKPDLTDQYLYGGSVGTTGDNFGGANSIGLTATHIPSHGHGVSTTSVNNSSSFATSGGSHYHYFLGADASGNYSSDHTINSNNNTGYSGSTQTGGSHSHSFAHAHTQSISVAYEGSEPVNVSLRPNYISVKFFIKYR